MQSSAAGAVPVRVRACCALLLACCSLLAACRGSPAAPEGREEVVAGTSPCLATVLLDSTPAGAEVSVGAGYAGRTPLRLTLAPGAHTITLEREGYALYRYELELRCGESRSLTPTLRDIAPPTIALEPLPAQVMPEEGLKIAARADDNEAVTAMALYIGDTLVHRTEEASLRYNVDTRLLGGGVHQGRVVAWDAASNEAQISFVFELVAFMSTAAPPLPTRGVAPSAMMPPTATPAPSATSTPMPTATATPTPRPTVEVSQGQVTLLAYDYEPALYTAPERVGHPYPLLDHDRVRPPVRRLYQAITLRNAYLEVVILPELGGRIYQMRYLPTGQPLLYNNRVVKPTRWGPQEQGWWLAVGGIEFVLPVEEHGYLTALPWEATVARSADGSATVSLRILEQTRQLDTRVEITLRPCEAAVRLRTTLQNQSQQPQAFQYWVNAMLSPGGHGVGPELRFTLPTDVVLVHSSGDSSLPPEGSVMPWPWVAGRDLSRYGNWQNWLGVFAPQLSAPFVAAYDEAAQIGMVHAFTPAMPGAKLFGFGRDFDDSIYADDGAQYVELWGGLTTSFWEDTLLEAGQALSWEETWYAVAQSRGVDFANADASLYARRAADQLQLVVASPGEHRWRVVVSQGEGTLLEEAFSVRPDAPYRRAFAIGNTGEALRVHILEQDGSPVLQYTVP